MVFCSDHIRYILVLNHLLLTQLGSDMSLYEIFKMQR